MWDRWITPTDDPLELLKQWTSHQDKDPFEYWRDRGEIELVTDDRRVIEHQAAEVFDKVLIVDPIEFDQAAEEIESTQFARLIAAAVDRSTTRPAVLWVHSRFLTRSWDAPRILLDHEYVDMSEEPSEEVELLDYGSYEEDDSDDEQPPPLIFEHSEVPRLEVTSSTHPDLVTAWMTTYGCQVRLVDTLVPFLQEAGGSDHVLMLAGTSGFSFGQNGWIGHKVGPLRSCHVRLPLVIGCDGPLRYGSVTSAESLPNLIAALADSEAGPLIAADKWVGNDQEFEPFVVTRSQCDEALQHAVTCASWFWSGDEQSQSLFLKPDDVDDVNDVRRLRVDVIEQLAKQTSVVKIV